MEPHIGSEQGGTRPVVVLQNDVGQTTRHEMRRIEEALMNSLEINEWDRRNADE